MVRQELNQLSMNRFLVAHDIKFKYGNIDHLVIRDDGTVFMIETKSHRGVITADGQRLYLNGTPFKKNPICQINQNIRWVRNKLGANFRMNPWIVAIVVFPNGRVGIRRPVKRVNVIEARRLLGFIQR